MACLFVDSASSSAAIAKPSVLALRLAAIAKTQAELPLSRRHPLNLRTIAPRLSGCPMVDKRRRLGLSVEAVFKKADAIAWLHGPFADEHERCLVLRASRLTPADFAFQVGAYPRADFGSPHHRHAGPAIGRHRLPSALQMNTNPGLVSSSLGRPGARLYIFGSSGNHKPGTRMFTVTAAIPMTTPMISTRHY